jgi:hypothetical protein
MDPTLEMEEQQQHKITKWNIIFYILGLFDDTASPEQI